MNDQGQAPRKWLARVAGLNASEPPPTHVHDWTASTQPGAWPGMPGSVCVAPGHVGDASESPPTEQHGHWWETRHCPACNTAGAHTVMGADDMPDHRWDGQRVWDASESPPTEQHGHWRETRHCPACNTAGAHTVMGADDMPDHRWDGQRVWDASESPPTEPEPIYDGDGIPIPDERFAALGDASESPPTEQAREWLRTDDGCTCTGCKERRERHEATVGDASESGQPPEASDE